MTAHSFVHLHVHTDASLKDGLGPVSDLVARAKAMEFEALAMTDHGTLANAVAFTIECEKQGIKPILGVEGYINIDGTTGHITLLADGNEGWENLVKLNNLGHASTFREPAFTLDQLIEHSDGLICLTGCVSSPLNSLPLERALEVGQQLKMVFNDRLIVEVMFISDMPSWERPLTIARRLKLPIVVTNDVHFAQKDFAPIHTSLTKMKAGFSYNSGELYLKSIEEMMHQAKRLMGEAFRYDEFRKWITNTRKIARRIRPVKLSAPQKLPRVVKAKERIQTLVQNWVDELPLDDQPRYAKRLAMELDVIGKMGYYPYFAILKDIIDTSREMGVRIGAGRGSGAGCLTLYALGITDIDSLKYGLSFERFLNIERKGMPDVDIDFDSEKRHLVIDYVRKKYKAQQIATYSRYQHKSLVHDLAKIYRIGRTLEERAAELGPESREFKNIVESNPDFALAYEVILGQIRHKGKHAGGVIITDTIVPIERTGTELAVAWTEGLNAELSYAGVVKFDLLGLSSLSVLRRLESWMPYDYGEDTHPVVFDIFKSGDLAGIFQFSGSSGIRDLTMKLQPESIRELTAINALYRPGALDAGTCDKYPDFKKSPREVPTLFEETLRETYGVIVYQEQLMEIIRISLGGTFAEADLARRVITKGGKKTTDPKHVAELEALRDAVVDGMIRQGLTKAEAKRWWGELETHGRYSFNKSHSVGYATIAWQMAWWKKYDTAKFYAESLNVDPANAQDYIMSAIASGIQIARPNVNLALAEWTIKDSKTMILPLSALKFLSTNAADIIVSNRPEGGYTSIKQFMELNPKRLVSGRARQALWYLGGFKGIEGTFADLQFAKGTVERAMTPSETMREFLGLVIPTPRQFREMSQYTEKGYLCGIINNISPRKSAYGPYFVFHLSPTGVFWSRDEIATALQKGQIVAVKISSKGKATTLARISL